MRQASGRAPTPRTGLVLACMLGWQCAGPLGWRCLQAAWPPTRFPGFAALLKERRQQVTGGRNM